MGKLAIRKFDTRMYIIDYKERRFFVVNVGVIGNKKSFQVEEISVKDNSFVGRWNLKYSSLDRVKKAIENNF